MMRNLKDLAHRIASGEEVGNLTRGTAVGIPGHRLGGGWCRDMDQVLAGFFSVRPAGKAYSVHTVLLGMPCGHDQTIPPQGEVTWRCM